MTTTEHAGEKQLIDDLSALFPAPDANTDAALHDLLARRADAVALLDVSYRTIDSPIGQLLLAATPDGLVRLAFAGEDHRAVLARLADDISPRILRSPRRLDAAATQLDEYFAGRRRHFEMPIDLRLAHGFRRTVLTHLQKIAYGTTASYAVIASAAGSPAAARAVGTACATNPIPVVVPCHRVVRSDGSIGQYGGGSELKRALLEMESA